MKISIQQDDITSCIEFEESSLHEFAEHLRNLLHTVWLPSQVEQIVPDEEALGREFEEVRKEAHEAGLAEGEVNNSESAQVIWDEGYVIGHGEGYKEGLALGGEPEQRDEIVRLEKQIDALKQKLDEMTDDRDRYMFLLGGLKTRIRLEAKKNPTNTILHELFLYES